MTLTKIIERLKRLGLPVAYMQFRATKKRPAPEPPFIVWRADTRARGADGDNNIQEADGCIELYTDYPDAALESRIEAKVLPDTEYRKNQTFIESEDMLLTAYEFITVQKGKIL